MKKKETMKKLFVTAAFFMLLSTPCFGMQSASLFAIEGTEWYILPSFSYGAESFLGFYNGDVFLCDTVDCSYLQGSTYKNVEFTWDSEGCIVNGWLSISGIALPFFSIGIINSCNSMACEGGFIVKISDAFNPASLD